MTPMPDPQADPAIGHRPAHYGDPAAEYEAARRAAVLVDRSDRGRVRVSGRDRIDLIHRLSTNDMKALAPGGGLVNVFLSSKGRVLDLFDALAFEDHLLLMLARAGGEEVIAWIRRFVFIEDVKAEDATAGTAELGVFGPRAAEVLGAAGADAGGLEGRDHRAAEVAGVAVTVGGAEALAGRGYRLIAERDRAPAVWEALVERGGPLGLRPAGSEVEEILRVEAGLPAPGRELTERVNPLEAELRHAISFTKGCYTGQEVVARLNTYDKVQRALRGLRVAGNAVPAPDSRVLAGGGVEAGRVTSAVRSPALGAIVALAYLEREHMEPGTRLAVAVEPEGSTIPAEVVAPPFVDGA